MAFELRDLVRHVVKETHMWNAFICVIRQGEPGVSKLFKIEITNRNGARVEFLLDCSLGYLYDVEKGVELLTNEFKRKIEQQVRDNVNHGAWFPTAPSFP